MTSIVDHPNRPSVALARYRGELHAQARAAESSGALSTPALLRTVASRVTEIGLTAECHYEAKVADLVAAAQDVLNGGGFAGDIDTALIELNRCLTALRSTEGRYAA